MKNITTYLLESKFEKEAPKCKTFGEFFLLYNNIESYDEVDKTMYSTYDMGYSFAHEEMTFDDFMKWLDKVKDNKITSPRLKHDGTLTFKMGKELYDLDWTGDE